MQPTFEAFEASIEVFFGLLYLQSTLQLNLGVERICPNRVSVVVSNTIFIYVYLNQYIKKSLRRCGSITMRQSDTESTGARFDCTESKPTLFSACEYISHRSTSSVLASLAFPFLSRSCSSQSNRIIFPVSSFSAYSAM